MNYNVIQQLLENGISEEEIINSLYKAIPKLGKKIGKLLSGGWSSKDILNYFSKDREAQKALKQSFKPTTPSEMAAMRLRDSYANIPKSQNEQSLEELQQFTKNAAPFALGVVAPYVGRAVAPMAEAALSRALPKNTPLAQQALESLLSPSMKGSQTSPASNVLQQPQQPPNVPVSPASMQQAPNIPQAKTSITDILNKFKGLPEQIDKLKASRNGPEEISAYLKKFQPKYVENLEKEAGRPIEEVIGEYLASKPVEQIVPSSKSVEKTKENKHVPELQVPGKTSAEILPETAKPAEEEKPAETKPIAKKDIVASPQGIGEVLETRNGKVLIDVDGKKHVIDEEELESEPKDIADLYDDLFNAIPDEYKSRMMNYAGYDEESNELLFRPHGGAAYVYKDIPKEFAEELKNRLYRAKTTGKNMYGMWHEGDQSYGAGMSKLIKELQAQYGGKGKEYIRKYMTLFDILGIPHEEKKRKEREERERRKRNG